MYHSLDFSSQRSFWIIIQPSERMKLNLQHALCEMEKEDLVLADHLNLYALLATIPGINWRPYLNYLEDLLLEIVSSGESLKIH